MRIYISKSDLASPQPQLQALKPRVSNAAAASVAPAVMQMAEITKDPVLADLERGLVITSTRKQGDVREVGVNLKEGHD